MALANFNPVDHLDYPHDGFPEEWDEGITELEMWKCDIGEPRPPRGLSTLELTLLSHANCDFMWHYLYSDPYYLYEAFGTRNSPLLRFLTESMRFTPFWKHNFSGMNTEEFALDTCKAPQLFLMEYNDENRHAVVTLANKFRVLALMSCTLEGKGGCQGLIGLLGAPSERRWFGTKLLNFLN